MKKKEMPTEDRRKAQRLIKAIPIIFKNGPYRGQKGCLSLDISGKGLCVQINSKVKKGDAFEMGIVLPSDPRPIAVKSTVVWCRKAPIQKGQTAKYHVGLSYSHIAPKDHERFLMSFCELLVDSCTEKNGPSLMS